MVQTEVRGHTHTQKSMTTMVSCEDILYLNKCCMSPVIKTDDCVSFLQDEYQFCYHAALEYLGSFDHYAT